ncbi:MAG: tRNA (adenosine(37)-N6)-threonylcarbamoyltransferase complex dimerization subunit type 1 TsaB [Clostridium sp.]
MLVLSVDSSSQVATCALLKDNILLGEYVINEKREHSVILMPLIQQILQDHNLSIKNVDGFVVSKGPGSFTGLRIGMATIKGLSMGSSKPYVSVSSLDALALSGGYFDGIICSMMDALRDSVYTCLYKNVDGKLEKLIDYSPLDLEELMTLLKEKNERVLFIGDGAIKHKEYITTNFSNCVFPPNHLNIVRASSLGEIGMNLLKSGVYDDDNSSPLYLKKPQAQRELEQRMGMLNGLNH